MKYFKYLATVIALLSSNNAGALSLNDAISESLANNLLLKMESNSVDIAEEASDFARAPPLLARRVVRGAAEQAVCREREDPRRAAPAATRRLLLRPLAAHPHMDICIWI